jgi:hypothetical protein
VTIRRITVVSAAAALFACSSLPDLTFDDGGSTSGGPALPCNCQSVPAGWTPVSFAAASRPTCPSATSPTDLRVAAGDGTPSCSCTCADVGEGCASGAFTLALAAEPTCLVAPTTASVPADGSACTELKSSFMVPSGAFAKATHAAPTSCSAKAALASPVTDGRLCAGASSGSCSADQACVPAAASGFQSCISKPGTDACPSEFPKRSTGGTNADESKACLGCACGAPPACTGGSVSVYDGVGCKTNGQSHGAVDIGSKCAATSDSNFTATHFKSTPPSGGCATAMKTPPVPGTLTFTDTRTVCCK